VTSAKPRSKPDKIQGKLRSLTLEEYNQALRIVISTTQKAVFGELLQLQELSLSYRGKLKVVPRKLSRDSKCTVSSRSLMATEFCTSEAD